MLHAQRSFEKVAFFFFFLDVYISSSLLFSYLLISYLLISYLLISSGWFSVTGLAVYG
ncbi:hypothetical protein [Lysinibacillus fusiformis]|uniref:hypothetical protein n=1 Tax=Lysinibacillus fusiformis TaxID=28031 RepID=UPI000A60FFD1|nr:hypothetical protein [Lysinibacillus fusiformis]